MKTRSMDTPVTRPVDTVATPKGRAKRNLRSEAAGASAPRLEGYPYPRFPDAARRGTLRR